MVLMITLLFSVLLLFPFNGIVAQSPDLIYGGASVEVNAQINEFENLQAGKPIYGSVMITHDVNSHVDASSFQMGGKPLQVTFVQSTKMSSFSPMEVTIYSFQLEGMSPGPHTLPPITVKVGGRVYATYPLTLDINH